MADLRSELAELDAALQELAIAGKRQIEAMASESDVAVSAVKKSLHGRYEKSRAGQDVTLLTPQRRSGGTGNSAATGTGGGDERAPVAAGAVNRAMRRRPRLLRRIAGWVVKRLRG